MKIFVFKTNISNEEQKQMVKPLLNQIKGITRWSVNLDDKDNSMRVEGHGIKPEKIKDIISIAGFECEIMY